VFSALHAVALALFGATLPAAGFGQSVPQPREKPQGVAPEPEGSTTGELQVVGPDGKLVGRFPLRHTEVHASVSGGIAEVTVEQFFQNPYDRSIEAVYVFPLPHDAAVNDLEIRIGERVVRGEIHERQKAREIYEQAKQQGRTAALLDQERPNVFTQSVANILPGHEVVVKLRYLDLLQYEDGAYEMVFPTVVGPRYIPGQAASQRGGTGWSRDTDRVPDASRITPPVVPPGARAGHDIMIAVELHTGVPLQDVQSVNHVVDVERPDASTASIRLRPSDTIPNKDFVLRWRVAGQGPEFGLLPHRGAGRDGFGYFTFLLQPEAEVLASEARPKEMVFVLDCSGSMSGEPIAKAKAAVRWALQNLNPDDTFQVIRFSERASPFAPGPIPNTPENVQRALAYVEGLQGEGGTEMLSGIEAALSFVRDAARLRVVCFLTDGYIGNEEEILSAVRDRIGEARLFSFGVGSSVNRYLLDELAREGRGVADFIPLDAETRPLVEKFYARIAKPYLTDVSIDWGGLDVTDVYPEKLPDLFAGQPLVLAGRYRHAGHGEIAIRGHLGRRAFQRRIRVDLPERAAGNEAVDVLWARRRIDEVMRQMLRGERQDLVQQVTDTALEFRLVTRYTSFVATDNQVVAKDGTPTLVPSRWRCPRA
jgi:Ca-activated chloride channel family protein